MKGCKVVQGLLNQQKVEEQGDGWRAGNVRCPIYVEKSYSLASLNGGDTGDYIGEHYRG